MKSNEHIALLKVFRPSDSRALAAGSIAKFHTRLESVTESDRRLRPVRDAIQTGEGRQIVYAFADQEPVTDTTATHLHMPATP